MWEIMLKENDGKVMKKTQEVGKKVTTIGGQIKGLEKNMVKIGKGDKGMKGTMDKNKNVGELRHERKVSTFILNGSIQQYLIYVYAG